MAPADALPEGALDVLLEDPAHSAVLTDFDGTLAAIVPDPEAAVPLPGAPEVLGALARRFAVVAVVSGRPAAFLTRQLAGAGPDVALFGGYGLEWVHDGQVQRAPEVAPWLAAVAEVVAAARAAAPPGAGVEDKGWGVTVHWRGAPEAGPWAESFARDWAQRTGLELQPGRRAMELRPPVALDKGSVVRRVGRGRHAACFVGDDAGDIAAFAALDELASEGVGVLRIAVADVESPAELRDRADIVVDGPESALALLRRLAV